MTAPNGTNGHVSKSLTHYCSFIDPSTGRERIGHLENDTIQPLAYASGTPLSTLYEVIPLAELEIVPSGESLPRSSTKLLAPINGRDILCVGKNYSAHAKEFNKSGFDSSDKVDQPTHPVIFTKRFTSIIADGEEILPHPDFTQTVDYEGELGVIIGKPGFRISEADAMNHVWGYTIINDMTARERQRDHKQFYIGKSPDTYCPMIGASRNTCTQARQDLRVQTRVNGDIRQDATTEDLIFSIPFLVMTLSEGQTLMPGDVLATGTPAGVGIGRTPPVYLRPGDEVSVSITGLGKLSNRIASPSSANPTLEHIERSTSVQLTNAAKSLGGLKMPKLNGKPTNLVQSGNKDGPPCIFVHGLGGTVDYWKPLIDTIDLVETHALYAYDFEGHGLSPTSPLSKITIASLASDLKALFDHLSITSGATLFAHSMGCLVAISFVLQHSEMVSKLVLVGPPPSPLPEAASKNSHARAALAREKGMAAVVDAVATAGTSAKTQSSNPLAVSTVRLSLLGQDPEGYAKACSALAEATDGLDIGDIKPETLIITGSEDKVSPPALCEKYTARLRRSIGVQVLADVGHWHVFEDPVGVADAVRTIL